DLGDRDLQLSYLGRGHTDNDIVIDVPDSGVLFAGDLLEHDAAPNYGDAFPRDWATTVSERLLPLVRNAVVPGHGGVGDRPVVAGQGAGLGVLGAPGATVGG